MTRKRKKSKIKPIAILLILIGVSVAIIAWRDGILSTTSIENINNGEIPNGTTVTVRAKMSGIILNMVSVVGIDGTGGLMFIWEGAKPATNSIVVIRGNISSPFTLNNVMRFEEVWLFK